MRPATSPGTRSSPFATAVGTEQDVSRFIGGFGANENEISIAINPANTQNLFVLSNADIGLAPPGPAGGIMASYTLDGGATWNPRYIATGNDIFEPACCDPSVAFDRFGNLWMSYLNANLDSTVILLSTDGGIGFRQVALLGDTADQPKLAVGKNSVWVVWNSATTFNLEAASAFIAGLGSFSGFAGTTPIPTTPNGTFQNFGKISVGPSDQVMVTFQNPTSGVGPDSIWSSVNLLGTRGTFATPILVSTTNVGGFAFPTVQPTRSVDAESEPAYDRSGGAHNGRVYVVYTDRPSTTSNAFDIYVRYSDNNGSTWSNRVRVTDDSTGQPKILPRIRVDQTTGNVGVSWLDGRNGGGTGVEEFMAFSFDGGQTFSSNIQVAPTLSSAILSPDGGFEFGDYTGLDFYGGVAYPSWPDNSTTLASVNLDAPNSFDVATAAVSAAGFVGSLPEDAFEPNESTSSATNFGRLNGSQTKSSLTITKHSNGLPDYDNFKWVMAHGGTFTATMTDDGSSGGLELHLFKLVNGSLVDVGDSTGTGTVKTLTVSVSAGNVIYVQVKGRNLGSGIFSTGSYHLTVSV